MRLAESCLLFFFQAEDGIRDLIVTGVQTCALPISSRRRHTRSDRDWSSDVCSSDLDQISYAVFCLNKKNTHLNSSHDHISYGVFVFDEKCRSRDHSSEHIAGVSICFAKID